MHNLWGEIKGENKQILYEHPCYRVSKYKTSTHLLQCNKKSFMFFSFFFPQVKVSSQCMYGWQSHFSGFYGRTIHKHASVWRGEEVWGVEGGFKPELGKPRDRPRWERKRLHPVKQLKTELRIKAGRKISDNHLLIEMHRDVMMSQFKIIPLVYMASKGRGGK